MYQQAEQEALLGKVLLKQSADLDFFSIIRFSGSWSCQSTWWSFYQWSSIT
jgi:hypothetical protein